MQRPAECKWERPECIGDRPSKRSGHTFTEVDSFAYLFGGCTAAELRDDGQVLPPRPSNELYKLDMGSGGSSYYWTKLTSSKSGCGGGGGDDGDSVRASPPPRWDHTANRIDDTRIVVFGGFSGSKGEPHLNDVWILDTATDGWTFIDDAVATTDVDDGTVTTENCIWKSGSKRSTPPEPRGSHSASIMCRGQNDSSGGVLVVFGGYGGTGYSRRDFADVHALCLTTWRWYDVKTTGRSPQPRSGHQSVVVEDNLYVMGGWNASRQFDDLHILDGTTLTWSQPTVGSGDGIGGWGPHRWNFSAVSVFAVPHRKIFVFGGNSGELDASNPLGKYRNDVQVLECVDKSAIDGGGNAAAAAAELRWTHPAVVDDADGRPSPRASSQMLYSTGLGRLVLFGGWSSQSWDSCLWTCEVSSVVGPPYNVFALTSADGLAVPGAPVTGGTEMILSGKGFVSGGSATEACGTLAPTSASASASTIAATIRLACARGAVDVAGIVVDDEEVRFRAPSFEKFGPVSAQCRLKLGTKSFTNGTVDLPYFAVTDCSKSVAFGPGLLTSEAASANDVGEPTMFIIQAKDKSSKNRSCGMDEFVVRIEFIGIGRKGGAGSDKCDDSVDTPSSGSNILSTIKDDGDGSYTVTWTPPAAGTYKISIDFAGTFGGRAGALRGSPFVANAVLVSSSGEKREEGTTVSAGITSTSSHRSSLAGTALQTQVTTFIKTLRSFALATAKGLGTNIHEDSDLKTLLSIKEHLRQIVLKTEAFDTAIETNRAALGYLKRHSIQFPALDKSIKSLESAAESWLNVKAAVSATEERIATVNAKWTDKIRFKLEAYEKELEGKLKDFRQLEFWSSEFTRSGAGSVLPSEGARKSIGAAEDALRSERKSLDENRYLCDMFDLDDDSVGIQSSHRIVNEMELDLVEMAKLWDVSDALNAFIATTEKLPWAEIDAEELEDGGKAQLKAVKALDKCTRWCDAFKAVDRKSKDFLATIPLVTMLGAKAMRPRHWELLRKATCASPNDFVPPCADNTILLGSLLKLDLLRHSNDVEEICDQATKEAKIESALSDIASRWSTIVFTMTPFRSEGSEEDIPLLGIEEEDYEALENDQLAVQGMLASRFVAQFQSEVDSWKKALFTTSEVFLLLSDIQRTWSYLEPLFIHSDEVKRELPEDATRFAAIDVEVRAKLLRAYEINNVKDAFNEEGLYRKLEGTQEQLDWCKKSLADFLDGRRRQFPRYYFVSERDLLDILSNGSKPESILKHVPKVYLSTKTFVLDPDQRTENTGRPIASEFVAAVGSEVVRFEPPVPLEGKVEIYMQTLLDAQKLSLFETVKRSLVRYGEQPRSEWALSKEADTGRPHDPAQTTLLVLAINYVAEVEQALEDIQHRGDVDALSRYSQKQREQLNDLIKLTRTGLTKGDRARIMNCITMDAHSRDVVESMICQKVDSVDSFQWQSQLKHKFRVPPAHAAHQGRDLHLRGSGGERAEVAICDAVLPYDYEYLGNGSRLVITPLTDRIYVTATQALNLRMGCAPAGPAGTGKTETTKDLANALGKCVYVINCSPEMDYKGLGNIFKGAASSGAWVCFDEFNRLIPEVLSVATIQFKAVCDGIAADASRIRIEGDEILLDPTCGAFITMNPGYLGRSELPEGLKALFRPMTVMIPDLVLICENMLMAEGFENASRLASKFFCLYSLLKALLSAQLHYDWGLRAIKSVLVVAGAFKRAEPELSEDALLMRALRDFNTPKIVKEDEVVFYGLLNDLFPGIDPPRKQDVALESYVTEACQRLGNDPDEKFRLKVVQLEELLAIRHCVFVMGPPGSGKSQCWRTLQEARNLRSPEMPTSVVDLNPKAVKTEELYGYISMATREWRDGLLSNIMRALSSAPDENPKWIVLDGDLDANWVESMNSVMDDNRMLTLASNERIPLLPHMRMIFEIRDLKHATPATVSRAGILYISTDDGNQWKSLIRSWLVTKSMSSSGGGIGVDTDNRTKSDNNIATASTAHKYSDEIVAALRGCFDKYVEEALTWLLLNAKSIVPVEDVTRVETLLNMLDGCLNEVNTASAEALETAFVYCAVWAMGSSLSVSDDGTDYRKLFSDWWRENCSGSVKFPPRDTVFDYWLNPETNVFDSWTKSPFFYSVDYDSRTTPMALVTVPTPETCSVSYWMDLLLVKMKKPVMLAGPTGTGKSALVNGMLNGLTVGGIAAGGCPGASTSAISDASGPNISASTINFNYYTTSSVLASAMSLPLEKKTGSNYGPPGTGRLVYFIDDMNLPEVDQYNTQSAIAHLRQHLEYEHCYELDKMSLKSIMNTQVVACMNPAAGSNQINPRLQRHFATFFVGLPGSTSLLTIYQSFLNGHFSCLPFADEVKEQSTSVLKAAMGLHGLVTDAFKKTAVNFFYDFTLREISQVFQGLLVSTPDTVSTPDKLVLLWLHESERVYGDRLVSASDLTKYNGLVQSQCKKIFPSFSVARYYSKENAEPLVFSHFAESIERPVYNQVTSLVDMNKTLDVALSEYNETNAAMDLVLFEDAMKHVARIVRIIRNESGHALLVGVGGSGKQSLARLAAFLCGYSVAQIVISSTYGMSDFKDDLKGMFRKAGLKEEGVLFLMTDGQIFDERCLVCVNSLLATGDIDGLFAADEMDEIVNGVANRVKAAGMVPDRKNCWDYFLRSIRKNLHVCLCFSPVGDGFRTRALRFPALVNCTVMDIFHSWPREALYSVGKKFLRNVDLGSDAERDVIERFLPFSFEAVNKAAIDFQLQEKRHVYTTPKSYLELIKLYSTLLGEKRSDSASAIERLDNGLTKLRETSESVAKLEEDLKVMLEDAAAKKEKAEGIAEVVATERSSVEVESAHAEAEKEQVAKIQKEVSQKQRDTEEDLAKAEPAVEAAMSALDTLDQKDLSSCKGMLKPPPKLDEVFAATMCLLAGIMPSVVTKKSGGQVKVKDSSWDAAKKQLMGNIREYMTYLKEIKSHVDNNTINHNNFKEVRQYIEKDYFNVETMKTKNQAAAGLCSFVINIVEYYDIVTTVEPKRQALREANEQLAEANSKLKAVTEHVAELKSKLAILTADLEEANASKQEAMDAVDQGERKLNLAQRLTNALTSENERWGENVETLRKKSKLLTGDVLLSSAFLSYAGPFSKPFRHHLVENVFKPFLLQGFRDAAAAGSDDVDVGVSDGGSNSATTSSSGTAAAIPMSDDSNPLEILTSEAEIAQWNADSLPADVVSSENGSIVCNASRWPLLIDPQLQGIRWVKQKEGAPERNLQIVRLGQKDMIRKLEAALENGHTIIIENIGESIDAVLNPVIQRATIKRGSRYFIKVGDKEVDFHPEFRLYLHTKLSNPHYPPEIQAETTIVNFTVTQNGLEDQLLNLVVEKERPDLAATSADLISKLNGFTITMKELEDSILQKLASAQGDITEDVVLISDLEETKRISNDIEHQSVLAKQTQADIVQTSERYRTVANRSSLLFFLMNDLSKIHTYYVFSLAAFQQVFFRAIDLVSSDDYSNIVGSADDSDGGSDGVGGGGNEQIEARCECLKDSITLTLFNYIRRGLFENNKLTVLTSLALKILVNDNKLDSQEAQYLVQSKTVANPGNMGPLKEWLPESIWPKIKALEGLDCFADIGSVMQSDSDEWSSWINVEDAENAKLPGSYDKNLTTFQKLILIRTLRPDRLPICMRAFIGDVMGKQYVSQAPFDMKATYDEMNNKTPIFFVLFAGVDPTPLVESLGRKMGFSTDNDRFVNISMGQGQEGPAEAILKKYAKQGGWVMLQNCHLMSSWVPKLERLLEVVSEDAHEDFRCFLSAEPPPISSMHNMPESLMQSCIKVANEAPSDIRSNLIRAWDNFGQETIDSCTKPIEMKACLFSLCWFHAVVCGRRRFGQQGWSRKYSFNTGDLKICANVLRSYLDANAKVPWDDLRYIFGEIMYGGHVTDAWDRRVLKEYLEVYLRPNLIVDTGAGASDDVDGNDDDDGGDHHHLELGPGFKSPSPNNMSYLDYIQYIDEALPPESPPLFGLHPNAEIKALSDGTDVLFLNILAMGGIGSNNAAGAASASSTASSPSSSTTLTTTTDIVRESMIDLLDRLPPNFEMVALSLKAKPLLEGDDGPYIVVALQECGRMNDLLSEIRQSLEDLHKGLEGQKNFSEEMSQLSDALSRNSWPSSWSKLSWPSEKNLSDNFQDLLRRCEQLEKWVVGEGGKDAFKRLDSIWLGGLFSPQSYITAMRQIQSRKLNVPLDRMTIAASVVGEADGREDEAIYATSLWLEGASVEEDFFLANSKARELLSPMPMVKFQAVESRDDIAKKKYSNMYYEIPIYYTSQRGQQFLLSVELPLGGEFSREKATLGGAAIFLSK